MKPFTYVVPKTLDEAKEAASQPDTIVKGAGLDVVDRMKERLQTPSNIVNLLPLADDMAGVDVAADGSVTIGALTTLTALEETAALQSRAFHALPKSASTTGTPQVRNRATVAGNILQFTRCWYVRSEAFRCLHGGRRLTIFNVDRKGDRQADREAEEHPHPSRVLVLALLLCGALFSSLGHVTWTPVPTRQ